MKRTRTLCLVVVMMVFGCTTGVRVVAAPAVPRQAVETSAVPGVNPRLANLHLRATPSSRPAAELVPVIQLRGADAAALGKSHGRQLGKTIVPLYRAYFGRYFSSPAEREACLKAVVGFKRFMLPEHVDEIRALASATGLTFEDLMLAQAFMDLTEAMACSTITLPAAASPDGVARFGRNLDFASFDIADKNSVVLMFHPKDRYAFASVIWPGMVGVLSGMNEHGLSLAVMEVPRQRRAPAGMPYAMLYRMLLERCKTVDEALGLLKKTPRHSASNLMLMDASGHRAVAEITPSAVSVRRAPDTAALISTNHHRGTDLDTAGRCDRFDALHDIARREYGRISEAYLEQFLGCAAALGNATIQSMIFEPVNRLMYVAVGAGAPARGYEAIDLKPYLR
ncbi:MAG TPA: C45 family autoproteolytic acyltransferase/hydrolase [Phycisphaerae bacterium]|nr:C45 family autoproteolytic acyltransferase/hydrolase [Phycisphaerae bacterium]HRY67025.1 C45 family autoproteolytic acyltransferase/hydrolase [Phycisphaerae bacterium]HSA27722.1 C45 family autoproteolytic acyltransferase/hydrolase [Phycisphaerae bacterium]